MKYQWTLTVLAAMAALILILASGGPVAAQKMFSAANDTHNTDGPPAAPQLVINEIDYDQPGTDAAEYVEIKNVGAGAANLGGVTLQLVNGTGGGAGIYDTVPLPNVSLAAGDHFVVCANAATVANCDLDDSPNTNFIQNGAPDAAALRYDGDVLDAVSYEGNTGAPYTEGSGVGLADSNSVAGLSISRCEDGSDTDQNNVDFVTVGSTPGAENKCGAQSLEAFVHEVQGSGSSVAITDLVVVEAIVVGDFQGSDQLLGFFIQEEDDDADSDPLTSEGILVFCGECAQDAAVGDKVQVTGWPGEYFGMSQIDATGTDGQVTIVSADNTLPTASTVDLPAAGSTVSELALEYVEGMLVTFPDTLVVSEYFQLARFGQLVLTADERPRQFTDANEPDVDNYAAFLNDLSSRRIILDDDNNRQNDALGTPDKPYYWPRPGLSIDNLIRGGDSIDNLTGVLHWSWAGSGGTDAWRVRPVNEAFGYGFTRSIPRPAAPDDVGGSLKVASFNVLNYFTTIDEGPDICGPDGNLDCRGAHSTRELSRQREKIVSAMITMDADVIGLMELENNTSAAMRDLVGGLNSVAGPGVYDFVDTGTIGNDAIKVGFIYKTETVFPVGDFAIIDSSVDPTFNDDKNRPALAQTFEATADRAKLTVVVNHLKSKGSPCDDVGDPNLNDGQGNCNQTRTDAAVALVNWLGTDPTNSNDPDFMIVGDLNSYRMEEPIDALKMGGYTDLLNAVIGPEAYTYLFDGQLGYLDYAMANGTLSGQVTGVTAWNINADEIPLFDYNDEILDPGERSFERESDAEEIYESNAFRASDHDPVLVGLDLNGPPVCSEAGPSIGSLWSPNHKFVEVMVLGVTDPEADPITINVDSIFQDEAVNSDGDGNTAPDAAGIGTSVAQVRSERDGRGNGRVYHISFTASDDAGNSCSGTVNVGVPANRGNEATAVDDGPLFDATIAGP